MYFLKKIHNLKLCFLSGSWKRLRDSLPGSSLKEKEPSMGAQQAGLSPSVPDWGEQDGPGVGLGSARRPDHQKRLCRCSRSKVKLGSQSTGQVQWWPGRSTAANQIQLSWRQVHTWYRSGKDWKPSPRLKWSCWAHGQRVLMGAPGEICLGQ